MAKPNIVKGVISAALALYYGFLMAVWMLYKQLTHPGEKIFYVRPRETPPKCLKDPALGQHGYATGAQGVKIHYVEKGDRSKPLMLFVHGFPEFWYSWRYQIKEFSKDYWVVAIDMRGYGDSDKPTGISHYTRDNLIKDIKLVVNELGREKFILVAHDWGAIVAWMFVDKHPEMVEKYIIMNGPHPQLYQALLKTPEQSKKSWYIFFFQLPYLPELWLQMHDLASLSMMMESKNSTDEDVEAFKYTYAKPGALTPPINYYRAMGIRDNLKFWLSDIKEVPKLITENRPKGAIIFGTKDFYLSKEMVPQHEKKIPNLSTYVIEGANHFVQQDDPVAVNREMRSFLSKP